MLITLRNVIYVIIVLKATVIVDVQKKKKKKKKNENASDRYDIYTMNNDIGGLELYGCFSVTTISRSDVQYIFRINRSNVFRLHVLYCQNKLLTKQSDTLE